MANRSIVVTVPAFHAGGRGSIPCWADLIFQENNASFNGEIIAIQSFQQHARSLFSNLLYKTFKVRKHYS